MKRIVSVLLVFAMLAGFMSMLTVSSSAETGNIITKMKSASWILFDPYAQGSVKYTFSGDSKATATYYDIDGNEYNDTFTFKKTDSNTVQFGEYLVKNTNSDKMLIFTYTRFNRSCVLIRADKSTFYYNSSQQKLIKKYNKYSFHTPYFEKKYNTPIADAYIIPIIRHYELGYYFHVWDSKTSYEGSMADNGDTIMMAMMFNTSEKFPYSRIYIEKTNTNKLNVLICEDEGEVIQDTWLAEFEDVYSNSWYHEAVYYVAEKGFMSGYSDRVFGSGDNLQRQDFVIILAKTANADLSSYKNMTPKNTDVKKGQYYTAAVNWATSNNIISGYENGKFGVGDPITREQICTILYRYKNSPSVSNPDNILNKFPDKNLISSFAKTPVAWAVNKQLINGSSDGRLRPTSFASRAEIAQIIMNADKKGIV